MPARKPQKLKLSEHDVEGHPVRILSGADREELWIDGTRRRFFKVSGGYVIASNAYVSASATLLEAVRGYIAQAETPKASDTKKKRGGR